MGCYRSVFIPGGLEVRCRTLGLLGELDGDLFESWSLTPEGLAFALFCWSAFPQPFTRRCLCTTSQFPITNKKDKINQILTFRASFRLKLFSQLLQGNGFTAKCILLCRLRSWFRLKLWGHWSHLYGRSACCCCW